MSVPIEYASFLVRLWRERGSAAPDKSVAPNGWQGELEHIQTGQRWTFGSLEELFALLRREATAQVRLG